MKNLDRGRWAPGNWERLEELIRRNAFQGRYACFDFDDTTSVHAVDHALFSYQVYTLRFAVDPERMREVLTAGLNDLDQILGRNEENRPVHCGDIVGDLCEDYGLLWRSRAVGAKRTALPAIRKTPEYRDFAVKLHWMRGALDGALPMEISYPWCVYLLSGFTPEEVRRLGREAIIWAMEDGRYGTVTLCSPEERPGAAGRIRTVEETGLTFPEEMRDLYRTLQDNGIAPYLVSASPVELVCAGSELAGLGVPPERIFAMRARRDAEGRYICAYDDGWGGGYAQTFGPGKSRVIDRFIAPRHGGRGPLLVCGDAESDMDMMTDWMDRGDTELGLVLNHLRDPERHPRLSRVARKAADRPGGRFLLQGLDKEARTFRPAQTTILENSNKSRIFFWD